MKINFSFLLALAAVAVFWSVPAQAQGHWVASGALFVESHSVTQPPPSTVSYHSQDIYLNCIAQGFGSSFDSQAMGSVTYQQNYSWVGTGPPTNSFRVTISGTVSGQGYFAGPGEVGNNFSSNGAGAGGSGYNGVNGTTPSGGGYSYSVSDNTSVSSTQGSPGTAVLQIPIGASGRTGCYDPAEDDQNQGSAIGNVTLSVGPPPSSDQ